MMEKFFYPKSVAVIGASHDEKKIGSVFGFIG
jgi:acyl-CoA synthetase (NDP forming)